MCIIQGVFTVATRQRAFHRPAPWMAGKLHEDVARERPTSRIQGVLRFRVWRPPDLTFGMHQSVFEDKGYRMFKTSDDCDGSCYLWSLCHYVPGSGGYNPSYPISCSGSSPPYSPDKQNIFCRYMLGCPPSQDASHK